MAGMTRVGTAVRNYANSSWTHRGTPATDVLFMVWYQADLRHWQSDPAHSRPGGGQHVRSGHPRFGAAHRDVIASSGCAGGRSRRRPLRPIAAPVASMSRCHSESGHRHTSPPPQSGSQAIAERLACLDGQR